MRVAVFGFLLLTGCDQVFGLERDELPVGRDIPHLPVDAEQIGTVDAVFDVVIDTTTTAIMPAVDGVTTALVTQEPDGPALMVVYVRDLEIRSLSIAGTRPLVIVARTIRVSGLLDAGGSERVPGAGGGLDGNGISATAAGVNESGGGGGAFASGAAPGGTVTGTGTGTGCTSSMPAVGAMAGTSHGTAQLDVLAGGGNGGDGSASSCSRVAGGGGGGAIQLSALERIDVSGIIDVSGGGGQGGVDCLTDTNAGSGGGGGAGGAIYLDAPSITLTGSVWANGGGGGAGGCGGAASGGSGSDGGPGLAPASGGAPPPAPPCSRVMGRGGKGAAGLEPGETSPTVSCGNGGGGGGGFGRIVSRADQRDGTGVQSPAAVLLPY